MADVDLQKLYAVFEKVRDLNLRKELYSAAGDAAKALKLERRVFVESLNNKRIETVYDYIPVLNEAALIGISSKKLLESFDARIKRELSSYFGLGSEYNPIVVAYLYRHQALFYEARFGVHYDEEDLQKAIALRQKGLEELLCCSRIEFPELSGTLAMLAEDSIAEAAGGVYLQSDKTIDALVDYANYANRFLRRDGEDFVRQNVEIFLYLKKITAKKPELQQKNNQARIGFFEALVEPAVSSADIVYSKKEKEDKNGFIAWRFKCACAYVQRAINFADRLSGTNDEVISGQKAKLAEAFVKLKEVYEHRKYADEDFKLWVDKLVQTENIVPDHKGSRWYMPEDDLLFPRKITLTANF